jgi:hypothetical protein
MRPRLVLASLACLLIAASPASAQRQRANESWGKPSISYLQYRTDGVECAYEAQTKAPVSIPRVDLTYMTDMAQPDASAKPGADPNMDTTALLDYAAVAQLHMSKTWRTVEQQLQPVLAQCLSQRGYHRFRMTKDQVEQLKKLPAGSRARNVYLWNLSVASVPR